MACSNGTAAPAPDAGVACLGCDFDASAPWTDPALPLHTRVVSMLHDCTGAEACHATGSGGLTITIGSELTNLVNVPAIERPELLRVAPGDPSASYMYLKLARDGGFIRAGMPASEPFDPRRPELARAWIEAGAP